MGVAMALDVGGQAFRSDSAADPGPETPHVIRPPSLEAGENVGAALRAIREFKGHSLDFIAGATRVRPMHLAAIESFDLDRLPSRPFAIGYIRAYAEALGQDPEAAVERFKRETPPPDPGLRAPVGDDLRSASRNVGVLVAVCLVIVAAVVAWNITRRVMAPREVATSTEVTDAALQEATANAARGPIPLGGPLPAPPEASAPAPYVTPGLAAASAAGGSADAAIAARAAAAQAPVVAQPTVPQPPAGSAFSPAGQVYGVGPEAGSIIFQAATPGILIIRGGDGSVYFARHLAAGEAYRAPLVHGLVAEASAPSGMRVYGAAGFRGMLSTPLTPLAQFGQ